MNNKAYFKETEDYFEGLTNQSQFLGDFVPMSEGELDNVIANKPQYPLLCLIDYEGKLNENKQRTIATRTITFAVLFSCETENKAEQRQRVNDAESIGLNILAKIEHDACTGAVGWLKNAFKKESVNFVKGEYLHYNNLHGAELSFDLDIKNPMHYDADFWTIK